MKQGAGNAVDVAIGRRSAELREKAGLTRHETAEHFSIEERDVAAFEEGAARMSADMIAKLARLYNCDLSASFPGALTVNKMVADDGSPHSGNAILLECLVRVGRLGSPCKYERALKFLTALNEA